MQKADASTIARLLLRSAFQLLGVASWGLGSEAVPSLKIKWQPTTDQWKMVLHGFPCLLGEGRIFIRG